MLSLPYALNNDDWDSDSSAESEPSYDYDPSYNYDPSSSDTTSEALNQKNERCQTFI